MLLCKYSVIIVLPLRSRLEFHALRRPTGRSSSRLPAYLLARPPTLEARTDQVAALIRIMEYHRSCEEREPVELRRCSWTSCASVARALGITGIMVRLPIHPKARPPIVESFTPQVTPHVTPQVADQLDQIERLIWMIEGEMRGKEIQAALRLKDRTHFRDTYLMPALAKGLLEMTVPESPRSRMQKYRLTERGRAWRMRKSR
jgi:hypothetical protein